MAEQKLSPLAVFDARIVQTPLQGLLRNMDSELARLLKQAMTSHNSEAERRPAHDSLRNCPASGIALEDPLDIPIVHVEQLAI